MTEGEWNACERPHPLLVFLRGEVPAELKGPLTAESQSAPSPQDYFFKSPEPTPDGIGSGRGIVGSYRRV